jgi:DNA polymerase-3 subunit beta
VAKGILIEVTKEKAELVATDYDIGVRCVLDTKSRESTGKILVNAAHLLAIVRELRDGDVTLDASGTKLEITSGGGRLSVPCMDDSDFPAFRGVGTDKTVKLPAAEIAGMLDKVAYAAGQEESRYAINGVFMKLSKRDIEMVATDARRLAIVRRKLPKDTKTEQSAILPIKLVGMIKKHAGGCEEMDLVMREAEVVLVCGGIVLVGRLVEGTYPKYEDAIPKDCDRTVKANKEEFRSALRQAMNFTLDDTRSVTIQLRKGKVVVEARVAEKGEASIVIEAEYEGPDIEVSFNPQYIIDAMARLDKDVVELQLKDSSRPVLISEGKELLNVVMPVRLRNE